MKKHTISVSIGQGSINHNRRKFSTENVDKDRTKENLIMKDMDIQEAYHHLFDEALEKYNAKQKRSDRRIKDYYKKIINSKKEKPFYEMIVQVGNIHDHTSDIEAKMIYRNFLMQFIAKNPNMFVFGAYIHLDEATPHMHIDFIPYAENQKRGLETRVSFKKALESQNMTWEQFKDNSIKILENNCRFFEIEVENPGINAERKNIHKYKEDMKAIELEAKRIADKEIQNSREAEKRAQRASEELLKAKREIATLHNLKKENEALKAENKRISEELTKVKEEVVELKQQFKLLEYMNTVFYSIMQFLELEHIYENIKNMFYREKKADDLEIGRTFGKAVYEELKEDIKEDVIEELEEDGIELY